jgi:hypothetical protein
MKTPPHPGTPNTARYSSGFSRVHAEISTTSSPTSETSGAPSSIIQIPSKPGLFQYVLVTTHQSPLQRQIPPSIVLELPTSSTKIQLSDREWKKFLLPYSQGACDIFDIFIFIMLPSPVMLYPTNNVLSTYLPTSL